MAHKLGQVFLKDSNIIRKICDFSSVTSDDVVVEIGCGEGVLTIELAKKAKHVIVVEIDEKCIRKTKETTADFSNITFVHQDILTFDFSTINEPTLKVVANIPYYISAKIMKVIIANRTIISEVVLMIQKEFAEKLMATPGMDTYTSLTLYTQYFFEFYSGFHVSRTCFKPIPAVDSRVIKFCPRENVTDDLELENVIRSGFWGRRKPLISALKKSPYLSLDKVKLKEVPFFKEKPLIRAEVLCLAEFQFILKQLKEYGAL